MKKIITAGLILLSSIATAQGLSLRVVAVDPIYQTVTRYQTIVETRKVCYRENQSNGMLERIVDGGFGSTEGLIGAAAGVAIGDKIGGKGDNDAARVIGGLIGNKIGNNVADSKRNRCEYEDVERREPYTAQEIANYRVTVEMQGSTFSVTRSYQPRVGDYIPVSLRVQ